MTLSTNWNAHPSTRAPRVRDVPLLAIYSHMVDRNLYLPDYPLGHLISAQLEGHLAPLPPGRFGEELERICTLGRVAPDLWMRAAVGREVSAQPLLEAAARALDGLGH